MNRKWRFFDTLRGRLCIWGRFAGKARKTPPYLPIALQNLKDPKWINQFVSLLLVGLLAITNTGLGNAASNEKEAFSLGLATKQINKQPPSISPVVPSPPSLVTIEPDPTIQNIINQVSSTNVYSLTGDLSGEWPVTIGGDPYTITTRSSRYITATEQVTQFAYEHFDTLGLAVAYHAYEHPFYGPRRNVVAEQTGAGQPERIFIITAHIDDVPSSPVAPGADDNASGSVGVMLTAQILSQYEFDCTLRYVLFTGEEQGLYGSYFYAQEALAAGDNIETVLNLDMIAYESDGQPILDLHTRFENNGDLAIANTFVDVVNAYNLALTPQIHQDGMGRSDHYSFWQIGAPAILAIEDYDDFTPYYHTANDKLETLNLDYFTDFIKATLGTFSHMGCMLGAVSGTVTDVDSSLPLVGTTVVALADGSVIGSTTTSAPDGHYTLDLALGSYTLKASHPGYIPISVADITVQGALTTTVDFSLETYQPISSADFVFQPQPAQVGDPTVFTGTVSGGTPPIEYAWAFGDGNFGAGQVVDHIYGLNGIYTVVMTTTNGAGSITATHNIQVEGVCIPITGLDFTFAPLEPMVRNMVHFTATLSAGTEPLDYIWDFGDGSIRSGAVVTHTFPGNLSISTYNITLGGDNLCSQPQSVEKIITVQPYQFFLPMLSKTIP